MKTICRFVWTNRGLRLFDEELKFWFSKGWILESQVYPSSGFFGFRWLLIATLIERQPVGEQK